MKIGGRKRLERVGFAQVRGFIALIRTALVAAGAVLSLAMLVPSTASATHLTETGGPRDPTVPWGFNEFWGFSPDGAWSGEQADREIELANAIMPRALSAHRLFVQWRRVVFTPKPPNEYDWSVTDRAYQAMQGEEGERKPVMVIHDAPDWARDPAATCPVAGGCTFPPDPDHYDDWQQFVQEAVTRYPNVRAIEVWNEPNLAKFWGPAPDPRRYTEVLAAAHEAVASAGIDVPVITGGLAPVGTSTNRISSREFLREIYNQGCACDFEGIGTHEYPTTEPLVDHMWHEINRLFAVRDNHNDPGTPLWNTEVGVSSDPTEGVGPERQGPELIRLYRSIEGHEIESFIIYRFHDAADRTPIWNHIGVVDQSLAPKPAYCELGAVIGVAACDTSDTTPPAPPSSLTAAAGNAQVALDWADNAEPDLAGYHVYRRNADGTWPSTPLASPIASSFTDTGLANGTSYTYRVTAYDISDNESAASSEASATPAGPTVKSYQPAGYEPVTGSVYSGRGAVSRLYSNDGSRVEISAARVTKNSYVAEIQPHATITAAERASLQKLSIEYDGNASSNSAAVTLLIRNFRTGQWETLDGPRTGVTSDRNFNWSNSIAPTDYVSGSGEVRLAVRGTSSRSFRTATDLVSFTIES
jgi:hypothetical protein